MREPVSKTEVVRRLQKYGIEVDAKGIQEDEEVNKLLENMFVNYDDPTSPFSALETVRILIEAYPDDPRFKNKQGRTPYQEREEYLSTRKVVQDVLNKLIPENELSVTDQARRKILTEDPIASHIRSYCVQRQIEFDLAGLPQSSISQLYLSRLANHLHLEIVLNATSSKDIKPLRTGRGDMKLVFDWLRKQGVQSIVKVIVIDDGPTPHSDQAIKDFLKGFDVRTWDWKKLDLCSEVISDSSKTVNQVSLYSSGNNAVLMGWASPQGFLSQDKFPSLQTIHLFIRKGYEDEETLNKYIETFTKCMVQARGLEVIHILDDNQGSYASGFRSPVSSMQQQHPWVLCMKEFASFFRRNPEAKDHLVRIAIIDDGLDTSLDTFNVGFIAGGNTFCLHPNSADLVNSYFVPSGKHGTRMAELISQICPSVGLYIARLEDYASADDNRRQITARSAAQAIQWAVDCDVDIISMSWTIEADSPGIKDEGLTDLQKAIERADRKKILMFCSASDQGNSSKEACYPDIPFMNSEGPTVSYESGSSVATAAASGLAGVLLHCSRALGYDRDRRAGEVEYFRERQNMMTTLKNLSIGTNNYAHVEHLFRKRFLEELVFETRDSSAVVAEASWSLDSEKALSNLMQEIRESVKYKPYAC
ncbi:hypothetical protein BDV95DRAFT_592418 [Massariosphaeria phaeospora]|uniref:Peptidase S8/S53 domain-containing protein n=1 Tax=Massariosphaeria phaeospora TaxID=100035 RepID=A0A7C8MPX2_9PLEO|nr:hypothetical protein BDV95DRAFT_592418 [Massariosphaeria phaeospora]